METSASSTPRAARSGLGLWRVGIPTVLAISVGGALASWATLSLPIHFLGWGALSFAILLLLVLASVREYLSERARATRKPGASSA